jgi:hypothetical protein
MPSLYPSLMSDFIIHITKNNWHLLNKNDRVAIKNEVQLAIATENLKMNCNLQTWKSFNYWLAAKI